MDKYRIYFMTDGDGFGVNLQPANEETGTIFLELLICFGNFEGKLLNLKSEYKATPELKFKISEFVDAYSSLFPVLNGLKSKISSIPDNHYFLVMENLPSDTAKRVKLELYVAALNETGSPEEAQILYKDKAKSLDDFAGDFLLAYDMSIPRTDRRTIIGNKKKEDRCCRFCGKSAGDGVTFKKIAHAISEGLGNKNIILADECDICNEYFGKKIEPTLIEYLDIYRVFLGVKGKRGEPKLTYKNGHMQQLDGQAVVSSQNIEKISDTEFKIHLKTSKKFVPENLYKALCKITLSTLDENEIPNLNETIDWLRSESIVEKELPKVAVNIVSHSVSKIPQIVNYIRKTDSNKIPHIVSEFRIGSFVYVYILPLSSKDSTSFTDDDDYESFWSKFNHYSNFDGWRFDSLSEINEIAINEIIHMKQTEA
tara:strand:+ start:18915 stop:20192 length:1278 start_codon:yes stop_codon:yes gene_type:complete